MTLFTDLETGGIIHAIRVEQGRTSTRVQFEPWGESVTVSAPVMCIRAEANESALLEVENNL